MPGVAAGRARRRLRRDERDARAAARASIRRRSGLPISAAARTTSRARSSAGRSSTAPPRPSAIDEMERLIDWLPAHLPPPAPVRLVHGDYRLDNIILAPAAPAILRRARLGALDARRSARRLHLSPDAVGHAAVGDRRRRRHAGRHDLAALGIPALAAYVDAYVARTGLDPRPHLPVYLAYNFFRLAAILQGIVGRVRDGTATSENAAAKAQMVRPLAAKALGVRARGGRAMNDELRARARRRRRARRSRRSRCSKRSTRSACGRPRSPAPRSAR